MKEKLNVGKSRRKHASALLRSPTKNEEIKAYGATLDDYISAWSDPPSDILSDIYQSRIDAAHQLKTDNSSSDQEYTVTSDAEELLHDLKLDIDPFRTFHGNVLQHTLHSEFVSMIDDVAPTHHAYGHIDSIADLNHLAVKATDIGRQYNASGDINNASYIADACWYIVYGLKEATIGAGEGVIQGVGNTGHMVYHYDETICNIGYGIAWLVNGVITNTKDGCTLMCGDDEEAAEAWDSLHGRVRHVKDALEYLRDNASIRDVTREVTSFAVEGYVCHQMVSALVDFYKKADRYAAIIKKYIPPYQKNVLLETAEGIYVEVADEAVIKTVESNQIYFKELNKRKTISKSTQKSSYRDPHDIVQYNKLNNELRLDEFRSIINCTEHGLKRLMERFTIQELKSVLYTPNWVITQSDGARVLIKKIGSRYAVVTINETSGELITALNKIDKKALINLSENYGWSLYGTEI